MRILQRIIKSINTHQTEPDGTMGTRDEHGDGDAAARRRTTVVQVAEQTGIDEELIKRLVHRFYEQIRTDPDLGPVFEARVEHWPVHLERMCAFWSSVILRSGRYQGRPMQAHAPLPVDAGHFDRWLALFEATASDACPRDVADVFIAKARLIAQSLELGIATHRGIRLPPGARLSASSVVKVDTDERDNNRCH